MAHQQHHDQMCDTANYVWSTRDRLGYGATGTVYVGYNKSNGERVAVKMFAWSTEFKSLKREIDVVRSLPAHENIIMFFGVEEEVKFKQRVIIMELCTGGSLYEVINSPENAYGLNEAEFKQLVYDVAKGLRHLRTHNFVHRDIKPGHIMRCRNPDGSYVFKLADFGTARELGPDETFISLHGTEEYLYPGIYERALVNPGKRHKFSAQVDLWSVGATFFHAATGRLPFQPFRKRDDKKLMYHMVSTKRTGVISGWQLEPNGDIIYRETLPEDTIISDGLKRLITPVLAGLLENDLNKMMTFDNFFSGIDQISRKKVVDVFCVYSCTCHKVYIDPEMEDGVRRLKELIWQQTGLIPKLQELFYENLPYNPSQSVRASKLPSTTPERPVFVFGGAVKKTAELKSPILPSIPSIPIGIELTSDVQFAKECAKVMWALKFHMEEIERMFRLMHQAALCYSHTLSHEYKLVQQQLNSLQQVNEATCRVLTSQISGISSLRDLLAAASEVTEEKFHDDIQVLNGDIASKEKSLMEFREAPRQMKDKVQQLRGEIDEKTSWDSKYCSDIFHRSVETLQFWVRSVESNYKTFLKERKHKGLTPHDQKVHEFTKIKLHQKLTEAQDKVVDYLTGREQVYSKLGDWIPRLIPVRHDISVVGDKMAKHSEECTQHLQVLDMWERNYQQKMAQLSQKVGMAHQQHHDQVCDTANYVWSTRDKLSHGANAPVYVGYIKSNGERVAVKVFTGSTALKSLKREIDVVRSLPAHENIVMLFGVEEEVKFKQRVIIMELCTGDSLYEVINSPENAYGLSEAEFKQLISDVAKGLRHLWTHNFVHRDIKPGNIMRCGNPDGSYVFKLIDFSTAQELCPGETFISAYGTEEYLYPGMYEKALINPGKRHKFSAQVDLWSVGATFFHAATGRLPFQPFRKRDDKKLMYHMISTKRTGVISGWQLEPNGDIIYRETLPEDIIISDGLKQLITPVLAGLLENDLNKMMTFDNFFSGIEQISRKKVVDVFCVYSCTCHKVYIDPEMEDGVGRLKELIQQQTGLIPKYQELFYENLPYNPSQSVRASKLPSTTPERPVFVFGGAVKKTAELKSPILPYIPSIPQGIELNRDVQFAKECAKVMWALKFHTEEIERMFRLMHQAALCYSHTLSHEYKLVQQQLNSLQQVNEATCRVLTSQISGISSLRDLLTAASEVTEEKFYDDIQVLNGDIASREKRLMEFREAPRQMMDKVQQLRGEIEERTSWDSKYCSDIFHRSVETLQFLVRSVESNYKTFLKERKHKGLIAHDQKVHEFTKLKLHQKLTEAQDKVVGYLTGREQVYSKLGDWFTQLIPVRHDISVVGNKMAKHSEECTKHLQVLNMWEKNSQHRMAQLSQKVKDVLGQQGSTPVAPTVEFQRRKTKLQSSNSDFEQSMNERRKNLESRTNMAIGVPEWEQQVYMPPEPPRLEQTNISTTGKPSLHLLPIFAPGQNRRRSSEGMEAEPTKNNSKPTLPLLINFKTTSGSIDIGERIGRKYNRLGPLLLQDDTGAITAGIEGQYNHNAADINLQILQRWINGEGLKPVTWSTLTEALKNIGLTELAREIEYSL